MPKTSPDLPPERFTRHDTEVNRCCKCHEDGSILHACHVSHCQLYQWFTSLPFTLNSTTHDKTSNQWTQRTKVSATLWTRYWTCCSSYCLHMFLSVYEKLSTLFSTYVYFRHKKFTSLSFRQKMESAANSVSNATLAPCFKFSPWLPALRSTYVWTNNQPRSWVGSGNPITT